METILNISNQFRSYIQTEVSFITARVKRPDGDFWRKLKRLLECLKGTKYVKIIVRVESLVVVRWCIDAS